MRNLPHLVGLTLIAFASTARAQAPAPASPPSPAFVAPAEAPPPLATTTAAPVALATPVADSPASSPKRIQVGISYLPMALGKVTASAGGMSSTVDGAFASGIGLSVGYEVLKGLIVGVAPQVIFNGKTKEGTGETGREWDLMLRFAYEVTFPNVARLYGEVLPGYSTNYPPGSDASKGLVVAAGVGGALDISDSVFVNLSVGYQKGFQSQNAFSDYKTNYLRLALGGGMRF